MKKNMMSFVIVGVIFFSLFFFSVGRTESNDRWSLFMTSEHGNFYYDKGSIKKIGSKIIKVWIKIKYTNKGKDYSIQLEKKETKLPTTSLVNLNYSIILKEVDCVNNTRKNLKLVDYDNQYKIINDSDFDNPKIEQVIPETSDEMLLKTVCPK